MASLRSSTPALQGVQRLSPNDSRNGSNSRALTALLESWVNDSRGSRSPGGARSATPRKRVRRRAKSQTNCTNGGVPSVARSNSLGSLRRLQASSNTYPTGSAPRQQRAALQRLSTTFYERKRGMRRKRSRGNDRKPVNGKPVLDPSLEKLAAVLQQIATMDALPLAPSAPPRRRRRRCAT